jgi:hypothetical protein
VAVELIWTDREGIRLAESMGKLINQLAKEKRVAADATVSMEELLNFAGDLGWDIVHVQYQSGLGDSADTTVSLVEVYFKRVL